MFPQPGTDSFILWRMHSKAALFLSDRSDFRSRNDVAHGFSGRMGFGLLFLYLPMRANGEISSTTTFVGAAATLTGPGIREWRSRRWFTVGQEQMLLFDFIGHVR